MRSMKNMKKIAAFSTALLMLGAFTLTGCGNKNKEEKKPETSQTADTNTTTSGGNLKTETPAGNSDVASSGAPATTGDDVSLITPDSAQRNELSDKKTNSNTGSGKNAGSGKTATKGEAQKSNTNAKGNASAKKEEDKKDANKKIDDKKGNKKAEDKKANDKKAEDKKDSGTAKKGQ